MASVSKGLLADNRPRKQLKTRSLPTRIVSTFLHVVVDAALACALAGRDVVGISRGAGSGQLMVSDQAARSIG
jgi:hypothetical protein